MLSPSISVIIPCYNQGHYIDDALNSLKICESDLFEIIIINDGSTDSFTIKRLAELEQEGYYIVQQNNQGLSSARNTGIQLAKGKYILPLDADNKIRKEYLTEALNVLEQNQDVAVVYGNAAYFGERDGVWAVGDYNLQKLMICNYIDACAVIRKSVFKTMGAYDTSLKLFGLEDWEFWLRISFAGYRFHYINQILFDYRVLNKSMSNTLLKDYKKRNIVMDSLENKFKSYLGSKYVVDFYVARFKKNPLLFMIKLSLISWFPRMYNYLLSRNKIIKGL
jgi:glycosyltransferase involved in cell wall biosynthesis